LLDEPGGISFWVDQKISILFCNFCGILATMTAECSFFLFVKYGSAMLFFLLLSSFAFVMKIAMFFISNLRKNAMVFFSDLRFVSFLFFFKVVIMVPLRLD